MGGLEWRNLAEGQVAGVVWEWWVGGEGHPGHRAPRSLLNDPLQNHYELQENPRAPSTGAHLQEVPGLLREGQVGRLGVADTHAGLVVWDDAGAEEQVVSLFTYFAWRRPHSTAMLLDRVRTGNLPKWIAHDWIWRIQDRNGFLLWSVHENNEWKPRNISDWVLEWRAVSKPLLQCDFSVLRYRNW